MVLKWKNCLPEAPPPAGTSDSAESARQICTSDNSFKSHILFSSASMNAAAWVSRLGLEPHPEGGFFRRHWASRALAAGGEGATRDATRPCCTSIYYLLESGCVSKLHSLRASDEGWFWHAGGPLTVVEVLRDGGGGAAAPASGAASLRRTVLGHGDGEALTHVVQAGTPFGALLADGVEWALVSCVVAPGFDFAEWRLEDPTQFIAGLPASEAALLARLG